MVLIGQIVLVILCHTHISSSYSSKWSCTGVWRPTPRGCCRQTAAISTLDRNTVRAGKCACVNVFRRQMVTHLRTVSSSQMVTQPRRPRPLHMLQPMECAPPPNGAGCSCDEQAAQRGRRGSQVGARTRVADGGWSLTTGPEHRRRVHFAGFFCKLVPTDTDCTLSLHATLQSGGAEVWSEQGWRVLKRYAVGGGRDQSAHSVCVASPSQRWKELTSLLLGCDLYFKAGNCQKISSRQPVMSELHPFFFFLNNGFGKNILFACFEGTVQIGEHVNANVPKLAKGYFPFAVPAG